MPSRHGRALLLAAVVMVAGGCAHSGNSSHAADLFQSGYPEAYGALLADSHARRVFWVRVTPERVSLTDSLGAEWAWSGGLVEGPRHDRMPDPEVLQPFDAVRARVPSLQPFLAGYSRHYGRRAETVTVEWLRGKSEEPRVRVTGGGTMGSTGELIFTLAGEPVPTPSR